MLNVVANRHICRFAPNARKKVIVPPPSDLALRTSRALWHVIGPPNFLRRWPWLQVAKSAASLGASLAQALEAKLLEGLRQLLPWPHASLEVAPCSCELRSHAFRRLPMPAPPLQRPGACDRNAQCLRGMALSASSRSSLTGLHNGQNPLNPRIERAEVRFSTSVKRRRRYQASERFSALTLPRILSVLISKLTF